MNPDQPSREQIEARITALLLGELPAAEAELLRFTISRDPELQKLHDQLKVTIGFVAEAMKNPTGAPVDRETPLKLAQERRQTLLAHFKTARPQAPQALSWLKRIRIPSRQSLMVAAIIILVICGLAAITLPNFVKARSTSLSNSIINNLRQIDAAKQEWALEQKKSADAVPTPNDLSPYLADQTIRSLAGEKYLLGKVSEPTVAEINGKQLIASRGTYGSEASTTSGLETTKYAEKDRGTRWQSASSPAGSNLNGVEGTFANAPTPAPIALPKTEPSQPESEESNGEIYSQSVVGYVNIHVPTDAMTLAANQLTPAQQTDSDFGGRHNREERLHELSGNAAPPPPSVANASPPPEPPAPEQSQTGSPFISRLQSMPPGTGTPPSDLGVKVQAGASSAKMQPTPEAGQYVAPSDGSINRATSFKGLSASQPAAPPQVVGVMTTFGPPVYLYATNSSIPPMPAGGTYNVAQLGALPDTKRSWSGVTSFGGGGFGGFAGTGTVPVTNGQFEWYLGNQVAPQSSGGGGGASAQVQQSPFQSRLQNNVMVAANDGAPAPPAGVFNFQSGSLSGSATNAIAMNQDENGFYGAINGQGGENERRALANRDQENAKKALENEDTFGLSAAASEAPKVETTPAAPIYLPPRLRQQYSQNEQKLSDSLDKSQFLTEGPASATASVESVPAGAPAPALAESHVVVMPPRPGNAATPPVEQSPRLENQNPNTVAQYNDSLHHVHNGAINPAPGQPEVASSGSVVPVVNGVPVTGELFPSSVLRSPAPQQQYAQNEQKLEKYRNVEAPEADKKIARYLAPSPTTNAAIPQPEILTSDNAFSTFSMNVSDVSFKLAMASLEKGRMPDPGSIRSEEFINAFDYHDPEPLQGEPLAFTSERALDPFAQERDMLRFSIKAAATGRQGGRALNLVLLLDTSGSMERADRVAIIREALRVLSGQLQPQDIVSVVSFSGTARLWADGIPGNEAGPTLDQVGSITPEGGTNLEEAMRLAYETALRHFIAGGMNRVVLLTDGAANLGNVEPQALTQKVDAERRQGIALDCFGIGWDDYNDDLLEQLSSNGDGRYAFINSPDEAATEFAAKLAGALEVAAEDVKVQVEFNPNRVTAWRQIGYAKHQLTKQQFRDNTVAAGAIASREAGNALYVVETRPDGEGPVATVRVRYRVPGTQDVHEHSWLVDYDGAAPELAQSSPAMRLAVTAAEISEWMAESPFAQDVTPDELLNYLSGVPQIYGTDERPKQLETMIREAKSISGR